MALLKKAGARDKLSLDDEDEEDDGTASMSPSGSPSRAAKGLEMDIIYMYIQYIT